MTMKKLMLRGISSALLLLGATSTYGQFSVGPSGTAGRFNLYRRDVNSVEFDDAKPAAEIPNPGWTVGGVTLVAPSATVGHLATVPNGEVNRFLIGAYPNGGWLGLTDADEYGGTEFGDTAQLPYPALKAGSTELRDVPSDGERGAGWIWVDGTPLQYQNWNGGEPNNNGGTGIEEDAGELIGGGAWNDLTAGDTIASNVAGSNRNGIQEWDLGLTQIPFQVNADIRIVNNRLEGKAYATNRAPTPQRIPGADGASYQVFSLTEYNYLPAVPKNDKGGLQITVVDGNQNSNLFWENLPALQGGTVDAGKLGATFLVRPFKGIPNWANSQAPGSANDYPAALLASGNFTPGGNRENYGARAQGEIFLKAGTYKFRDGADDYARLVVNGEKLIDDNSWTGLSGTDNGNGGVAPGSEVPVTVAADGWYSIDFDFAEGGGGDNWRLYWDRATAPDETGAAQSPPNTSNIGGTDWYQVPAGVLRQKEASATKLLVQRLISQPQPGFGIQVPALAGNDLGSATNDFAVIPNQDVVSLPVGKAQTFRIVASFAGTTVSKDVTGDITGGGGPGVCEGATKGDANCSGRVDIADFSILRANFNKAVSASAVPEPSSLVLFGLGSLAGVLTLARRRR